MRKKFKYGTIPSFYMGWKRNTTAKTSENEPVIPKDAEPIISDRDADGIKLKIGYAEEPPIEYLPEAEQTPTDISKHEVFEICETLIKDQLFVVKRSIFNTRDEKQKIWIDQKDRLVKALEYIQNA